MRKMGVNHNDYKNHVKRMSFCLKPTEKIGISIAKWDSLKCLQIYSSCIYKTFSLCFFLQKPGSIQLYAPYMIKLPYCHSDLVFPQLMQ